MKRYLCLIFLAAPWPGVASAQAAAPLASTTEGAASASSSQGAEPALPFTGGEELRYDIRYLGVKAAEAKLRVSDGPSDSMRLHAEAKTVGASDSLFGVRESASCTVASSDLAPTVCRNVSEKKGKVRRRELRIDQEKGTVRERKLEKGKVDEKELRLTSAKEDLHDALSGLYLMRQRLPEMNEGPLVFPSMRQGKAITVEARVVGSETLQTAMGPQEVARIDIRIVESQEKGATTSARLWITTDSKRLPVRLSLTAPIGSLEAELVGANGTLAQTKGSDGTLANQLPAR